MAVYAAQIDWRCEGDFASNRYSRAHLIRFDGGVELAGSASPHIVPPPLSTEAAVDPEELFLASLSACHMLWFLDLARRDGLVVDAYSDAAEGVLAQDAAGRQAMTEVVLRPRLVFGGEARPSPEAIGALHHRAHDACFIANSVKTKIKVEPDDRL